MSKPQKRASILVTRWFAGAEGGGIAGEHTQRVSLPLSTIKLVQPYRQDIWIDQTLSGTRVSSARAQINLRDDDHLYVTETVEEIDALMNEPWGEG
ncbi:MAG TPA: hypothetical protein VKD00_07005 [Methyloceanibacter sp.]|nr:hypothetical protein [Methyloceanibacter sp.]